MQSINNLSARINRYQDLITTAANRVIASGWWILGPECKKFERLFAQYLGVNYCLGVANGTEAIELALKAMGVQTSELVATVANAGMYTTSSILAIGARPYFMDVDSNSYCVTLEEVIRASQAGAKVIVITHLYGKAVPELVAIMEYCKHNNIYLLEDCAQAHGAQVNGKYVGSFGNVATFSFYPTKNLGALGDAGAIATNDEELSQKIRLLSQYGWSSKYKVAVEGGRNSRLDEIQAAILCELLPFLEEMNNRRREIAKIYSEGIQNPLVKVSTFRDKDYVAHLYIIRCKYRDELSDYLGKFKIGTEIHYPIPDHRQPLFNKQFTALKLKNTEELSQEILTLPCYPEMNNRDIEYIIAKINGWTI